MKAAPLLSADCGGNTSSWIFQVSGARHQLQSIYRKFWAVDVFLNQHRFLRLRVLGDSGNAQQCPPHFLANTPLLEFESSGFIIGEAHRLYKLCNSILAGTKRKSRDGDVFSQTEHMEHLFEHFPTWLAVRALGSIFWQCMKSSPAQYRFVQ